MNAREHAIAALVRLGYPIGVVKTIVRALPAIQRAHEAACNWPGHVAAPFDRAGCLAAARIARALRRDSEVRGYGQVPNVRVVWQTDPRGCCVELWDNDDSSTHAEPVARLCANGFTTSQVEHVDAMERRRQENK